MKFSWPLALTLVLVSPSFACSKDGSTGFVPENDINIPVGAKTAGGISEEEFNAVIAKVEDIYLPVAANLGGKLKIVPKWTNANANASAMQFGSSWYVHMNGGLARHESITVDGFTLVLCHEIGHHLGGAPKGGNLLGLNQWSSNEGQADYFATLKCLRKVFLNDNNAAIVARLNAPSTLVRECAKAHARNSDRAICIRSGMAGLSVAGFFAAMRNRPVGRFETPDSTVVVKTYDSHPSNQCRLDTYLQGALCDKSENEDVSQTDEVQGTCHRSQGYKLGVRPLCWFRP